MSRFTTERAYGPKIGGKWVVNREERKKQWMEILEATVGEMLEEDPKQKITRKSLATRARDKEGIKRSYDTVIEFMRGELSQEDLVTLKLTASAEEIAARTKSPRKKRRRNKTEEVPLTRMHQAYENALGHLREQKGPRAEIEPVELEGKLGHGLLAVKSYLFANPTFAAKLKAK